MTLFTVDVAIYFCGENTEFESQIGLLQILDPPLIIGHIISDMVTFSFFNFLLGKRDYTITNIFIWFLGGLKESMYMSLL